jgi:hypothetical protein
MLQYVDISISMTDEIRYKIVDSFIFNSIFHLGSVFSRNL